MKKNIMQIIESIKRQHDVYMHGQNSEYLHPGEFAVLHCLHKEGEKNRQELQPSQISNFLNLPRSAITQILNRAESKGYLQRSHSKEDRRVSFVTLNAKGEEKLLETKRENQALFRAMETYIGEEDMAELTRILDRIHTFYQEKNAEEKGEKDKV